MLYVTLSTLHHGAAHTVPAFAVSGRVSLWKMQIGVWHHQFGFDATETQLAISAFKGKRMCDGHLPPVQKPLIHSPKMRQLHREVQLIDDLCHQRQLLRWPDR